jgi:hypothetical protein
MTKQQMYNKLLYEYNNLPELPLPVLHFRWQTGFITKVINAGYIIDSPEIYGLQTIDENGLEHIFKVSDEKLKAWIRMIINSKHNVFPCLCEFGKKFRGNSYVDLIKNS